VRHLSGLADPGDDHYLLRFPSQLGQGLLQDFPNGEIAAAGAPGDVGFFHIKRIRIHHMFLS